MLSCGLDFGTSNSALAVVHSALAVVHSQQAAHAGELVAQNNLQLAKLEANQPIIPSAIFFNTEERKRTFGQAAINEYVEGYEGRLMRALKSVLGSSLMRDATGVAGSNFGYADIIGLFINHLKTTAENQFQQPLDNVVLGRPVFFVDNNPTADQQAQNDLAQIAADQGFKQISFEYEPIAAAIDYEATLDHEAIVLTIDIGGGTSDFSLMKLSPNGALKDNRAEDILAHSGIHIGGTDFDKSLSIKQVMPYFGLGSQLSSGHEMPVMNYFTLATWHEINDLYTYESMSALKSLVQRAAEPELIRRLIHIIELRRGHYLAQLVEAAKIDLSAQPLAHIDLSFVEKSLIIPVSPTEFANNIARQLGQIVNQAKETINQAGLQHDQIDTLVLTGGSTLMIGFEDLITQHFPKAQLHRGERFSSIAQGLGRCAWRRY